jgi:FKBP-type peptidyl-prolyl cis-trans isomerase (trigger factor)
LPGTGDSLRRTSDALLRDIEALLQLEEEKRSIDPSDPKLVDLAARIELIAKRVLASSTSQRAQTQLIHELVETGSPAVPETPIEDTPRSMEAILAAWRQAERQLDAAEPGSAEAMEAELLVDNLREEYRRAHEEAARNKR